MNCPQCSSTELVKNGIRNGGKQNFKCKICGKQFVKNPAPHYRISNEKIALVDKLLLERISLAAIARLVEVSEHWLQHYVNNKYKKI